MNISAHHLIKMEDYFGGGKTMNLFLPFVRNCIEQILLPGTQRNAPIVFFQEILKFTFCFEVGYFAYRKVDIEHKV